MHTSPGQGEQVGYQKSFDVDNINAQKTACIWIACFNILVLMFKTYKTDQDQSVSDCFV